MSIPSCCLCQDSWTLSNVKQLGFNFAHSCETNPLKTKVHRGYIFLISGIVDFHLRRRSNRKEIKFLLFDISILNMIYNIQYKRSMKKRLMIFWIMPYEWSKSKTNRGRQVWKTPWPFELHFLEPILFPLQLHVISLATLFPLRPKMLYIGKTPAVALDQGNEVGHLVLLKVPAASY